MSQITKVLILALTALVTSYGAMAEEASREQLKNLDEQVQTIKSDVLKITTELNLLEEKLLYPSSTAVTIFVSLPAGETFRLDSLDLTMDGKMTTHHLYTFKQLEALRKGGVQRLYTGNMTTGDHPMTVHFRGKLDGGDIEQSGTFTIHKGTGPGIVEVVLSRQGITFRDE